MESRKPVVQDSFFKFLEFLITFILIGTCFMLLWIWTAENEIDGKTYPHTPQGCADVYWSLPDNLRSRYDGPEAYINACVE